MPTSPVLYVQRTHAQAKVPAPGSAHAAGLDLSSVETLSIPPGRRALVNTGIRVAIPFGYYGRVAPRSGLALKYGIDTLAGVIDSDYRGDIGVLLINHGDEAFDIWYGDRIAQLVIERICHPRIVPIETLRDTHRGEGGFGSTGK